MGFSAYMYICHGPVFHIMILLWASWLEERRFRHEWLFPPGKQGRRSTKPWFLGLASCPNLFLHLTHLGQGPLGGYKYEIKPDDTLTCRAVDMWSRKQPPLLSTHRHTRAQSHCQVCHYSFKCLVPFP